MFTYPTTVAGVRTRVLQSGVSGPAVILLHGLSARADRFARNLDGLAAQGYRVYALDLPGHGFADKGANFDYSARGYSAWLQAFIDMLGEQKVVMVGTSFGGLVAGFFAAQYRQRVHALVAIGAIGLVPIGMARRQRTVEWLPQMAREQIRARHFNGLLKHALITDDLVEEDHRINTSPGAAEAFACLSDYYRDHIDEDVAAPRLAALGGGLPVKLIWGEKDASVSPDYGIQAQKEIPGATLEFVPGTGHFPYWEKPEEFNALLTRFLATLDL